MRTEANLEALEELLLQNCGDMFRACKRVGLSPAFVRRWMADDPKVNERLTNATECGALSLESYAIEFATKGAEQEVWYQGEMVGTTRAPPSAGLMQFMLRKRLKHTYGDDGDSPARMINNGVINIMPRAENYDQWIEMRQATEQALLEDKRRAEAGVEIEDAEYEPVPLSPEDDPAMRDFL